jgi:hypothetical protein
MLGDWTIKMWVVKCIIASQSADLDYQRTYTMSNMFNQDIRKAVEYFTAKINQEQAVLRNQLPKDMERMVHVEVEDEDDKMYECFYYCIDPERRILFWLNDYDANTYLFDFPGVSEPSHISVLSFLLSIAGCRS